jgi:uncharacterized delta-60 repeat protein
LARAAKLRLPSFGANDFDAAVAVALQPNGKIVAAGFAETPANAIAPIFFALARYNTDGTIDTTFGNGGKVTTDSFGAHGLDAAFAVVFQPDAKIVAAGYSDSQNGFDFALARYIAGPIAGDFLLSATPSSQTVTAGQSTSFGINVQAPTGAESLGVNTEASSVTLSATVSPSTGNISTRFTASPVSPPGSSTLNVTTTKAAAVGTYIVTITGRSASVTRVTTATLIVPGPDFR